MPTFADYYRISLVQPGGQNWAWTLPESAIGGGGLTADCFYGLSVQPTTNNSEIIHSGWHWNNDAGGHLAWTFSVNVVQPKDPGFQVNFNVNIIRIPTVG